MMQVRFSRIGLAFGLVLFTASPVAADVGEDLAAYLDNVGPKPVPGSTDILPRSANPYLALLPDTVKPDWVYWNARGSEIARGRAAMDPALSGALPTVRYREEEPAGVDGENNDSASAEFISLLGTDNGELPRASVEGFGFPMAEIDGADSIEDDGAIPLANLVGLLPLGTKLFSSGVIGDGPHGSGGSSTGDFDFFKLSGLLAGQDLVVDVDTPEPFADLDPFVALWDSTGAMIAFNDDDDQSFDSLLMHTIPADGDYYVSIGGFGAFVPTDPFDPTSGPGAGSEGVYEVSFSTSALSIDYYAVDLQLGDVLGASVVSGLEVALFAPDDTMLVGSQRDLSFLYPAASFLPGGGPSISYIATQSGLFTVRVATIADYDLDIRVFRPGLSPVASEQRQTLFIDFDGAEIDTLIFGPSMLSQPRTLSPLADFLAGWGLGLDDEDAVIDAILDTVRENLAEDLAAFGLNGDRDFTGNPTEFAIEILNSRDHDDPFGAPNISRVIVGGTIAESGIRTIGIAESIDPGNFARNESALLLLDILSAPPGGGTLNRLNNIPLDPSASIIDLIGVAVGNIVAHEAGHYFGNWHTAPFNPKAEIMDQGGNPISTFGLGPDKIFGTPDDVDVDLDMDVYAPNEGFVGTEDTLNRTAFGLSTGRRKGGR